MGFLGAAYLCVFDVQREERDERIVVDHFAEGGRQCLVFLLQKRSPGQRSRGCWSVSSCPTPHTDTTATSQMVSRAVPKQSRAQQRARSSSCCRTCRTSAAFAIVFIVFIVAAVVVTVVNGGSFALARTLVPPPFALFELLGGGDPSVQVPQQRGEIQHVREEVQLEGQVAVLLQQIDLYRQAQQQVRRFAAPHCPHKQWRGATVRTLDRTFTCGNSNRNMVAVTSNVAEMKVAGWLQ